MHRRVRRALPAVVCLSLAAPAASQSLTHRPLAGPEPYAIDSGPLDNPAAQEALLFARTIRVEGAAWLRVHLGPTRLAPGSVVRVTAALDGQVQHLDAAGLAAWGRSTAYFNGDEVTIELIAAPGSTGNRLRIEGLSHKAGPEALGIHCGICDPDDRVPSDAQYTGRLLPDGCTAAVYDPGSCLLTAGHCVTGFDVVQFRVPPSDPDCGINHPPVVEQFPITAADFVVDGFGNDWAVLAAGTNELGQTIYERYAALRPPAAEPAAVDQPNTIRGYGTDSKQCTESQTQQSATGIILEAEPESYIVDTDATFGNSGSAILVDGQIIGVYTHCGYDCSLGQGGGTSVHLPAFAGALQRMCAAAPAPCRWDLDDDDVVGAADLQMLVDGWGGSPGGPPDFDGDGVVGIVDLLRMLAQWGRCP